MKLSKRASQLETSPTRKLYDMAKQYNDVINLTLGDPDIQPCWEIKKAACDAIMDGKTRYSSNAGLIELRKIICDNFQNEYGVNVRPEDNVIVTVGGMEALYLTFTALLDSEDEVIVLAPYYVNYVQMIKLCGGTPVVVNAFANTEFRHSIVEIKETITEKTVAIVLNSPSNPTGVELDSSFLDDIAEIAIEHDLVVISDEVYRTILYDNKAHDSIIKRSHMQERTILIDSVSKRFAMTGYRLGYAVAPKNIIESMVRLQENVCACAPLPSQYAAICAYKEHMNDKEIGEIYEERRDYLISAIGNIGKINCVKPDGTFYLFINISETGMDCTEFAYKLLEQEHVAVVPGVAYGKAYTEYVRIAYTLETSGLREAVKRLKHFIEHSICEKVEI